TAPPAAPTPPPSQPGLIVVAPEALLPALEDFVAFKRTLLPTTLVSLEASIAANEGCDDAEKLKRALYAAWKDKGVRYALLVGDVDVLPVRYMVLDRVTTEAFDYSFYPSDLYYADLARQDGSFDDWNARKDGFHAGYFGEVRGEKNKRDPINFDQVDYRPDIAVGRWPVNTLEETKRVAAKSIAHERRVLDGTHPALRAASFIAVGGWVDARGLMNTLAARLPAGWTAAKRYYADPLADPPADPPAATAPAEAAIRPPTHAELIALLNSGTALVLHAGHGNDDSWDQCLSMAHLDRLHNEDRLPIMISAGCSTAACASLGPYTPYTDTRGVDHKGTNNGEVFHEPPPPAAPYQRGAMNATGLGEQLLRRGDGGAVAYIGCNTGSQPCGLTLLEGFVGALRASPTPRLGDCWNSAVSSYYDAHGLARIQPSESWYPASIFFQCMKFMVFGDPSLRLAAPAQGAP
ncbi:MAG: hypothetical protein JNK53_08775, partial [Phycisphaerae bacterium]|nr:hypothetical protein [Phycisphaerae bacterium]